MGKLIYMDLHEFHLHGPHCDEGRSCVYGIAIDHLQPWLLDTELKVALANEIREKIGGLLLESQPWRLGDHCWYRPITQGETKD